MKPIRIPVKISKALRCHLHNDWDYFKNKRNELFSITEEISTSKDFIFN